MELKNTKELQKILKITNDLEKNTKDLLKKILKIARFTELQRLLKIWWTDTKDESDRRIEARDRRYSCLKYMHLFSKIVHFISVSEGPIPLAIKRIRIWKHPASQNCQDDQITGDDIILTLMFKSIGSWYSYCNANTFEQIHM